jgi:hypothetical protein
VSYFPAHPLAVSKETAQVGTRSGPSHRTSHRTSLELLPGAAQVLRNYGIEWEIGNSTKKCHTAARISERSRL